MVVPPGLATASFKAPGCRPVVRTICAEPSTVWAASPWTEGKSYQEKMFGKLDFGLKNLVTGPFHLICCPLEGINKEGALGGVKGLGAGVVNAVTHTVGGALHTLTFPITNLDVPLPEGCSKCPCSKA